MINVIAAYDLNKEPNDRDRQKIRDDIEAYCKACDACQLSESCYYFSTDKPLDEIFNELKSIADSNDVISVADVKDLKTNSKCVSDARFQKLLASLRDLK